MELKNIIENYEYFKQVEENDKEIINIIDTYQGKAQKKYRNFCKIGFIALFLFPLIPTILISSTPPIKVLIYAGTLIFMIILTFTLFHFKIQKSKNIIKNQNKIVDFLFDDKIIFSSEKVQVVNDIISEKFSNEEMEDIIYFKKHKNTLTHNLIMTHHRKEIENPFKNLYVDFFEKKYAEIPKEDVLVSIFEDSDIKEVESIDKKYLENFLDNLDIKYREKIINILDQKIETLKEEESKKEDKVLERIYTNKEKNKIIKEI